MHGLLRAREAGHEVPDAVLDRALGNLSNQLAYASDFSAGGEDIAYALYDLARAGRAVLGDLRYYFEARLGAFRTGFAKAQLGAGMNLPQSGKLFVSVKDSDKPHIVPAVRKVIELGFSVCATGGTADYLAGQGIEVERVNKVAQGRPHIVDKIIDGEIALVFNTTEGWQSLKDSEDIRRSALMNKVSYFTTASASLAATQAIEALRTRKLEVRPLQDYHKI